MGIINMKIEGQGFDALVNIAEGFGPEISKEATIAVNRTAKFHKNQIAKEVTKHVKLKQKDVKEVIDVEKSRSRTRPMAKVIVNKTSRLSLKRFGARQTKSGVSYRISKSGKRGKIKDAFIVDKLGGHVFRRKGKKRLPIQKLYGVSVAGVYNKQNLYPISEKLIAERLNYEMLRRVRAVNVRLIRRKGRANGLSTDQINQQLSKL